MRYRNIEPPSRKNGEVVLNSLVDTCSFFDTHTNNRKHITIPLNFYDFMIHNQINNVQKSLCTYALYNIAVV